MGPLPLLTLAFALGMLSSRDCAPVGLAVALGLCALAARVGPSRSLAGALLLLVASFLVGASLHPRLILPALTRIPPTHADRVSAVVIEGCAQDSFGTRCRVDADDLGPSLLHLPAGRCAASPGDRIDVIATVRALIPERNPPLFSRGSLRALQGPRFRLEAASCERTGASRAPLLFARRVALSLRGGIHRSLARALSPDDCARALALLFGDTSSLSIEIIDDFRISGLAHLLAVSGAHVALLVSVTTWILRGALRIVPFVAVRGWAHRLPTLVSLGVVGLFVMVTGESPSSLRALFGALVVSLCALVGRAARPPDVLALVCLVMLAVSPWLLLDPGFQLSVAASWALGAGPPEDPALRFAAPSLARRVGESLFEALRAGLRVSFAVTPILAMHFGRAPLTATVMNLLAAPLAETLTLPAVLFTAALPTPLARAFGRLTAALMRVLFALPTVAAGLPLASIALPTPTAAEALTAAISFALALRFQGRSRAAILAVCALSLAGLELAHRARCRPHGVLRVTALDVGQGDAIVIDLPDGAAMLIDGGGDLTGGPDPGARIVAPWLALHRRTELAAVVLSHPHPDHYGGLPAVLSSVRVGSLWDTGQGALLRTNGGFARLHQIASQQGVRVRSASALCGSPFAFHGATVEVLWPCPTVDARVAPNDASFVIRLSYGRASVLLPGDLERGGEARVMARITPTTVLEVGHHGSRTSTTDALLDRLAPRVAMISCGHPSPFGHPHPEVIARLQRRGIRVLRTDLAGAVSVTLRADGSAE